MTEDGVGGTSATPCFLCFVSDSDTDDVGSMFVRQNGGRNASLWR